MLKKLIKKIIGGEIVTQLGKPDNSARLAELEKENAVLKAQLESSGPAKRLRKLKEIVAAIPNNAQGVGMISVIENGTVKNVELKSRQDLTDLIARAEKGEVEVLLS